MMTYLILVAVIAMLILCLLGVALVHLDRLERYRFARRQMHYARVLRGEL